MSERLVGLLYSNLSRDFVETLSVRFSLPATLLVYIKITAIVRFDHRRSGNRHWMCVDLPAAILLLVITSAGNENAEVE